MREELHIRERELTRIAGKTIMLKKLLNHKRPLITSISHNLLTSNLITTIPPNITFCLSLIKPPFPKSSNLLQTQPIFNSMI